MIRKQFPSSYDVEQTIKHRSTPYNSLKAYTQSHGFFVTARGKSAIADFMSNILFDHEQYMQFRKIAQGGDAATAISGFTLQTSVYDLTEGALIDDYVALKKNIDSKREKLMKRGAPIPKLSSPIRGADGTIEFNFDYERLIPGRVELMQRIETKVALLAYKSSPTKWQFVCYPQSNSDVKAVQDIFNKMPGYETETISLDHFANKDRIQFFDNLIYNFREKSEWQFEQVTEITLQSSESENDNFLADLESEDEGDESLAREVDRNDLASINQAFLQGQNLRENSFVKDCEKQGFYFLSMALKLKNSKSPELIQVRIRFKLSPKMFEVVLISMMEQSEIGEQASVFSDMRQREILREVWQLSHEIWNEIDSKIERIGRGQMSFSNLLESSS